MVVVGHIYSTAGFVVVHTLAPNTALRDLASAEVFYALAPYNPTNSTSAPTPTPLTVSCLKFREFMSDFGPLVVILGMSAFCGLPSWSGLLNFLEVSHKIIQGSNAACCLADHAACLPNYAACLPEMTGGDNRCAIYD